MASDSNLSQPRLLKFDDFKCAFDANLKDLKKVRANFATSNQAILGIAAVVCAPLCTVIYFISKEYFDEILVGVFVLYAVLLVIFIFKFIKLLLGFKNDDKKPVWEQILTWLSNIV